MRTKPEKSQLSEVEVLRLWRTVLGAAGQRPEFRIQADASISICSLFKGTLHSEQEIIELLVTRCDALFFISRNKNN